MPKYFIVGGAGFIGSNLVRDILAGGNDEVTVFDNFTSGREWHFRKWADSPRLKKVVGDVKDVKLLTSEMRGHELVYHLASNPDIAKAVTDPTIDFWEGTYLTQNVVEAMRVSGARKLIYASGSGVYGDAGEAELGENFSPMRPTSTYGASKLAGEALICAYCHMFELRATCLRFANVVGPNQTHGVGYDFVRKLRANPTELLILGDGRQSKSYIHVEDVISAMRSFEAEGSGMFDAFNVATGDYATVLEIAEIAVRELGLSGVQFRFTGGDRGWKGDIPVVRFNSQKLRARGWRNRRTSIEALTDSIRSIIADLEAGLISRE